MSFSLNAIRIMHFHKHPHSKMQKKNCFSHYTCKPGPLKPKPAPHVNEKKRNKGNTCDNTWVSRSHLVEQLI